jgi:hypothetical protein
MLIEDFFEAVERAFTREADRIPPLRCLELKTPLGLPLSVRESPQATRWAERHRLPERCRLPDRRCVSADVTHIRTPHLRRQGEGQ